MSGFTLNNKWRFPKNQLLIDRIVAVMGDDCVNRMIKIENENNGLRLSGFVSVPTLRRASSIDQYLFVNGRPVKDKVLIGALRGAYMDVMHAREFPLCALYGIVGPRLMLMCRPPRPRCIFLEPARIRGFIIKTIRGALAQPMAGFIAKGEMPTPSPNFNQQNIFNNDNDFFLVREQAKEARQQDRNTENSVDPVNQSVSLPLGRVIGQIGNKYILAENQQGLVIIDQHAAHERITYERLRGHEIKMQKLLVPNGNNPLKPEEVMAVLEIADELAECGLNLVQFGDNSIAISEKPADWDLDWTALLRDVAMEVLENGHSSQLKERLHLKLANYACHHSVRAGQRLTPQAMDALLRDIENTQHGGECNHGRPVYKIIPISQLDGWFERS